MRFRRKRELTPIERRVGIEVDQRTGCICMPLHQFPEEARAAFLETNELPRPPAKWRDVPGGQIVSRAYYEWYASRGKVPPGWDTTRKQYRPKPSQTLREAVLARDGMVCQLCGDEIPEGDLHLDHIEPLSLGGPTTLDNLQATHSRCNIAKGARVAA